MSWYDQRCTAEAMGFNSGNISSALDAVLDINRHPTKLFSQDIQDSNWKKKYTEYKPFYLDFESFDEFFFMIGVGWEENGIWCYRCFYTTHKSNEEERRNLVDFIDFVHKLSDNPLFVHWSNYEKAYFQKLVKKHKVNLKTSYEFEDLYRFFVNNKIVVKGALNFSLKSVANAMKHHGFIDTIWKSNACMNGLDLSIAKRFIF